MDMLRLQSFLIHDPDRLKRDYWVNRILIGSKPVRLHLHLAQGLFCVIPQPD